MIDHVWIQHLRQKHLSTIINLFFNNHQVFSFFFCNKLYFGLLLFLFILQRFQKYPFICSAFKFWCFLLFHQEGALTARSIFFTFFIWNLFVVFLGFKHRLPIEYLCRTFWDWKEWHTWAPSKLRLRLLIHWWLSILGITFDLWLAQIYLSSLRRSSCTKTKASSQPTIPIIQLMHTCREWSWLLERVDHGVKFRVNPQ